MSDAKNADSIEGGGRRRNVVDEVVEAIETSSPEQIAAMDEPDPVPIVDRRWLDHLCPEQTAPLPSHETRWCAKPFALRRVVLDAGAPRDIVTACTKLRVLCVDAGSVRRPSPGDVWVGASPPGGWGAWPDACEGCGQLRSIEGEQFAAMLHSMLGQHDRKASGPR